MRLLTGRPPYLADKPMGVMFAHCSQEIPDPQLVVPELPTPVRRSSGAMAKYPADRYDTAGEMLADLEQAWPARPVRRDGREIARRWAAANPLSKS